LPHSRVIGEDETSVWDCIWTVGRTVLIYRAVRTCGRSRGDVVPPGRDPVHSVFATVIRSRRALHLKRSLTGGVVRCAEELNGNSSLGTPSRTTNHATKVPCRNQRQRYFCG